MKQVYSQESASPLRWPADQSRTLLSEPSRFSKPSVYHATQDLLRELELLCAVDVVVSTNLRLRRDGLPYSGQREPDDPGVAVWFLLGGEPHVLACDRWNRIGCNLRAIAKHVEALRGQERWGVGTRLQAFAGFRALPAPASDWAQVLGVSADATRNEIEDAYRERVKEVHPDRGGNQDQFERVVAARRAALQVQP